MSKKGEMGETVKKPASYLPNALRFTDEPRRYPFKANCLLHGPPHRRKKLTFIANNEFKSFTLFIYRMSGIAQSV
jgi:hypothetical protein